jgi:hypothetical protein
MAFSDLQCCCAEEYISRTSIIHYLRGERERNRDSHSRQFFSTRQCMGRVVWSRATLSLHHLTSHHYQRKDRSLHMHGHDHSGKGQGWVNRVDHDDGYFKTGRALLDAIRSARHRISLLHEMSCWQKNILKHKRSAIIAMEIVDCTWSTITRLQITYICCTGSHCQC